MKSRFAVLAGALVVAAMVAACGGSSPTEPSSSSGTSAATIVITPAGVNPANVTIPSGSKVTFVNNDTVTHEMSSDPHPIHTECPALNIGALPPGQSRDSSTLTARRACGFHDHLNPDNAGLRGSVLVQ